MCRTGFHVSFNKKWNYGHPMMSLVLRILQSPQRPSSTSFCGGRDEINLYNVEKEKKCVQVLPEYMGEPARNRERINNLVSSFSDLLQWPWVHPPGRTRGKGKDEPLCASPGALGLDSALWKSEKLRFPVNGSLEQITHTDSDLRLWCLKSNCLQLSRKIRCHPQGSRDILLS